MALISWRRHAQVVLVSGVDPSRAFAAEAKQFQVCTAARFAHFCSAASLVHLTGPAASPSEHGGSAHAPGDGL